MKGMETTSDSMTSLLASNRLVMKSIVSCNFVENSLFSPVFVALKMAEEFKPAAFNVELSTSLSLLLQNRTAKSQMIFDGQQWLRK